MPTSPKAEAERWLLHAERDLGLAKLGLELGGFYAQVGLMAHHSAEKALKGLMFLRGVRLVQEQTVSELLLRAADVHPGLAKYRDIASQLDQYYLISRYLADQPDPNSYELIDQAQAKDAVSQGENLILEVRNILRLAR